MAEAQRLCDRIAVIHKGRICAVGTPSSLMQSTGTALLEDAFVKLVRSGEPGRA
jgi:ABC-type Na+ transport system ATPase subunit NatA